MVRPLKTLLDRECELMYYMNMSRTDIMDCDSSELDYIHGWLVDRKQKEKDAQAGKEGKNARS